MLHQKTIGIILRRTNFGEADRILTVLTPDYGKMRLIAKGVRKQKSKLAGGLELLSISQISFIPGKKEISTLISTRLQKHFGNIVKQIDRTMTAYECLKLIDKYTQDLCEKDYFLLAEEMLISLNDQDIRVDVAKSSFLLKLLGLRGHEPNLVSDKEGEKLALGAMFRFDFDSMSFYEDNNGQFYDKHVKLLRLMRNKNPKSLKNIGELDTLVPEIEKLLNRLIELNQA